MEEVLQVLKQIKKLIAIGSYSLLITAVLSVVSIVMSFNLWKPYKTQLEQSVMSESALFQKNANDYVNSGHFEEAMKYFKEYESSNSGDPYLYFYRGKTLLAMKEYSKAIADLKKAELMMPGWKNEWTGPLIEQARKELK